MKITNKLDGLTTWSRKFILMLVLILGISWINRAYTQVEFTPWGNITGIRIDGELMAFESSFRVVKLGWEKISPTKHYWVPPSFKRTDNGYTCSTEVENLSLMGVVENIGTGKARMNMQIKAKSDVVMEGAYFCVEFSEQEYANGTLEWIEPVSDNSKIKLETAFSSDKNSQITTRAKGITIVNDKRNIKIVSSGQTEIIIRKDGTLTGSESTIRFYHVYFTVIKGNAKKNQKTDMTFDIEASGVIDREPIQLVMDASNPGCKFDGIGGNYRLQFPETDPIVIDYCFEHLNVTWSRIGMWWSDWHPEEKVDPIKQAKAGNLKPIVYKQMEMIKTLAKQNIPVIVSVWFPPKWAALSGERRPGTYGDPLNPHKWEAVVGSFTKYLLYLKNEYGVEAELFSFNEPDIGVSIAQNHHEHITIFKMLGKSFAKHGLSTKLIVADASNGTPYSLGFVKAAIEDACVQKYIGAIGFHTWGAMESENLKQWAEAARTLNIPLMVTEAGPDAEAHRNPDLFLDASYQHQEIDLYIRIAYICQPLSIMEWQFTADYSVLTGAGIYGTQGPLKTTQRFWNLKQLGLSPAGSFWLPISWDRPNLNVAACGQIMNGIYTIHIVNSGAARTVTLKGLPENVKTMKLYTTSYQKDMVQSDAIDVQNGEARFEIDGYSYITLINN